jgi:hypothetical protein
LKKQSLPASEPPAPPDKVTAIDCNTPLRLAQAAEIAFPGGGMTASALRREASRGRLTIERIAGKDYVTLAEIDALRPRCRREATEPASGPHWATKGQSGSSETPDAELALAAARAIIRRRKERSPTLPKRPSGPAK